VALIDRPPGPVLKVFLKAPIWLYRFHLGWLLGNRFLCIAHRGRKSGKLHRTVVEVVRFGREAPEVSVVAGWGPSTQWYRNLEAASPEEVIVGRRHWRDPQQRFLDEPERVELLASYASEHPTAARELGRAFGVADLGEEGIAGLASRTRAVAFKPSSGK